MSDDNRQNGDGKHVVVQGGQRVGSQDHTDRSSAVTEAEALQKRQKALQEGGDAPAGTPEVKQNLFG